jgi:hypothetical protein
VTDFVKGARVRLTENARRHVFFGGKYQYETGVVESSEPFKVNIEEGMLPPPKSMGRKCVLVRWKGRVKTINLGFLELAP